MNWQIDIFEGTALRQDREFPFSQTQNLQKRDLAQIFKFVDRDNEIFKIDALAIRIGQLQGRLTLNGSEITLKNNDTTIRQNDLDIAVAQQPARARERKRQRNFIARFDANNDPFTGFGNKGDRRRLGELGRGVLL
ncbi:MAG: hypothetical protein WD044_01980 [Dongiaceae bacterium]